MAAAATEDYLLMIALHGTADHVQKTVRHFRHAKEIEELGREARQQANRYLSYSYDEDGSLLLQARLPADAGALVLQALTAAVEQLEEVTTEAEIVTEAPRWKENVSAETPNVKSTPRQKRADALVLLSESFLANGPRS